MGEVVRFPAERTPRVRRLREIQAESDDVWIEWANGRLSDREANVKLAALMEQSLKILLPTMPGV